MIVVFTTIDVLAHAHISYIRVLSCRQGCLPGNEVHLGKIRCIIFMKPKYKSTKRYIKSRRT